MSGFGVIDWEIYIDLVCKVRHGGYERTRYVSLRLLRAVMCSKWISNWVGRASKVQHVHLNLYLVYKIAADSFRECPRDPDTFGS